ncbi:MAG: glycosyltransferase family 39 protein [Chloroflexi bacterium]|nr:glycosyltransferase family 39 protein [Chloroflexota bacterium]
MQTKFTNLLPWYFIAAAFQSLLAIAALLRVPSEGISLARLALLAVMAVILLGGIGLGLYSRRNLIRFEGFFTTPIILSSTLLSLLLSLILFLLRYLNPERLLPYYERISPLLWLFFFLTLEATILILLAKNGFHPQTLSNLKPLHLPTLTAFCLLLSVLLFVTLSKIGITPDTAYWGEPGAAIQAWHFILALLIGFAVFLLTTHYSLLTTHHSLLTTHHSLLTTHYSLFTLHSLFPITLYLLASLLWLSVPLSTLASSFYAPISPPTNVPLPYSDAGFYDFTAQSLQIGSGYFGGIPPRPLYVTFLAILHFLFGQNYPAIITAQVLVLALFPVALYFLGRKIHSPAAGVTIALFAIFREYTSLWIASNTRVVNSKTFTTDFPTAFGMVLICLVVLWWLERRDFRSTLIAGGSFGLLLLFRTQSTLTLPALFLLVLIVMKFKWGEWLKTGIIFAAAMILTVLPWLTHNYTVAGKFSFDDPNQVGIIFNQYSFDAKATPAGFDPAKESVRERIISFTLENPGYVANFIASHFLNTEIGGLLALPLIKPFNGFQEPVNLYWVEWDGTLEWYNLILVLFYLLVIALGFGSAWRRLGWLSLVPLAFNLGYALSNGIARFSSWRYNLPVDWVIYFYFGIGIVEIFGVIALLFGSKPQPISNLRSLISNHASRITSPITNYQLPITYYPLPITHYLLPITLFFLIGSLPWLAKGLVDPRYTSSQDELIARLESKDYNRAEIEAFLSQSDAVLLEGRLLYPRMYWREEGLASTNPWTAYAAQDFPRIGFLLINSGHQNLIFPTRELLDFKQGADATILACSDNDLLTVHVIAFDDSVYQSAALTEPCP